MLLDLGDDVDFLDARAALGDDADRVVDLGEITGRKFNVDHRADHLDDRADALCRCCLCHDFSYVVSGFSRTPLCCLRRRRARHDLDDLARNRGLTHLVHVQRQVVEHLG